LWVLWLTEVFKRIQAVRKSRFLATFAAALLATVTRAFQLLADFDELGILHNLMTDFVTLSVELGNQDSNNGKELAALLDGFITTYVPVYLGNQMLFWSGRYWEKSHPIFSHRVKSADLVNPELEQGLLALAVYPGSEIH
jgi:hypothetical protein